MRSRVAAVVPTATGRKWRSGRSPLPATSSRRSAALQARARTGAFTLVELIVVMVLLLIVAALVAPRMSSFFHGRVLSNEARRMLSLINYGQSRAIAEGVPMLVWIDSAHATYGLETQPSFDANDAHAVTYAVDPTLSVEPVTGDVSTPVDADADVEPTGMPENLPVIRFTPTGTIAEGSISQIVIRQGDEGALQLVPAANRLRYEIRPLTN